MSTYKKRRDFGDAYPGYYDAQLLTLFTPHPGPSEQHAWRFLRRHRSHLVDQISRWGHLRKYSIDGVLRRMGHRAKELDLYLRDGEADALNKLSISITAMLCEQRARRRELGT